MYITTRLVSSYSIRALVHILIENETLAVYCYWVILVVDNIHRINASD